MRPQRSSRSRHGRRPEAATSNWVWESQTRTAAPRRPCEFVAALFDNRKPALVGADSSRPRAGLSPAPTDGYAEGAQAVRPYTGFFVHRSPLSPSKSHRSTLFSRNQPSGVRAKCASSSTRKEAGNSRARCQRAGVNSAPSCARASLFRMPSTRRRELRDPFFLLLARRVLVRAGDGQFADCNIRKVAVNVCHIEKRNQLPLYECADAPRPK